MSKRKQKKSQMIVQPNPPRCSYPAVSVIIPLYNAEKYLTECLDSILAQTFQNFELIIVDDCSTDSSCAIVESYVPKFGGRLTLTHLEQNSGSGALPRNKGLILSRGEYIFFADADDIVKESALEELYTLAKEFDADVVYCESYFEMEVDGTNIRTASEQKGDFVDKPTFETQDTAQRVENYLSNRYWVVPWNKLVRRNLMLEHEIFFPNCLPSEDHVWNYGLILYAKNFLRVPNKLYIYRLSEGSTLRKERSLEQNINFWLNPILFGIKTMDKFMSKLEYFQQNPKQRYIVLENFIASRFGAFFGSSSQFDTFEFYYAIKHAFEDKFGEYDVLFAALCTSLDALNKINVMNNQRFNQFATEAIERIAQLEAEVQKFKSRAKEA